jgi:hypothetical protein
MSDRGAVHARYNASGDLEFFSTADPTAILLTIQANGTVTPLASSSAVAGVAAGYAVARGETALDGSNPTPVATGLATVIAAVATLKGTAAPGVGTSVLTTSISGATVNVYAWKVTSNADPTLIASTGTESFYWTAIGTPA